MRGPEARAAGTTTAHHTMTTFAARWITAADIATMIETEAARCACTDDHAWRIACLEQDIKTAGKRMGTNWCAAIQLNCEAIAWHQQQLAADGCTVTR